MLNKFRLWDLLCFINDSLRGNFLCFSDFKETMFSVDKDGGVSHNNTYMDAFCQCLEVCGLQDLGFCGSSFT